MTMFSRGWKKGGTRVLEIYTSGLGHDWDENFKDEYHFNGRSWMKFIPLAYET